MDIKINAASADTKAELLNKIKNKDFTFNIQNSFKAALINTNELTNEEIEEIQNTDETFLKGNYFYFYSGKNLEKIAFLFPGQGSQYLNMGKGIKDICDKTLYEKADKEFLNISSKKIPVSDIIFGNQNKEEKQLQNDLQQTDCAQPAIGITSAVYLDILKSLNIKPSAASGHSFGEITALFSANVFDYETFIKIASTRGRLMADCGKDRDAGSMMAVLGTADKINEVIKAENLNLIIANKNSPKQNVVSGETAEIENAAKIFKKHKLRGIKLPVAAAFHSHLVKDAALPFSQFINSINMNKPQFNVTSNTSGNFHSQNQDEIKDLLSKQLTSPVCFTGNMEALFNENIYVFIEVGPKKVLKDLAKQSAPKDKTYWFASVDESCGKDPIKDLANVLGLLFVLGFEPDIKKWNSL